MKKNKIYIGRIAAILCASVIFYGMFISSATAGAQALTGSYFLDNSLYRNRLNPAFVPRASYFGLSVLTNTGVDVYGSIGVSDVLYPKDGQLYTFLNENVSTEEFAKNLAKYPGLDLGVNTDILNFGFFTSPYSFWNFNLGVKVNASVGVPRDILMIAKDGTSTTGNTFKLNNFYADADAFAYAALGYSHNFEEKVPGLSFGFKARFYVSVAHVGLDLNNTTMTLSGDRWAIDANATGTVACPYLRIEQSASNGSGSSVSPSPDGSYDGGGSDGGDGTGSGVSAPDFKLDIKKLRPAGYGFSVDLGFEYRLSTGSAMDGLSFSVSAIDVGGIFYDKKDMQSLKSKADVNYVGAEDLTLDGTADFNEILNGLKDDALEIANFEEVESSDLFLRTCPKVYAGVEMPFAGDRMSVGLLYSGMFGRSKVINELTVSYNLNPCRWFNLSLNWSFLNNWKTLGWIMEFSPRGGVDFFIGTDYTFFEVMPKYYAPVGKLWTNTRFGLNFMVGSKHRK